MSTETSSHDWIAGAIKHKGALREKAKKAGMSTDAFAEAHKHDGGKTGAQARLGLTLMGMHGGKSASEKMHDKSLKK